ncbi:MAG: thiamine phosphate synthase [Bacillus sp. (in: Bacteria)]|nr:thiamine phosphate synthase [Bacillus sp. (in: firmicutes)]
MARAESNKLRDWLKVYFIAGTANVTKPLPEVLRDAIDGGVTLFQYREKGTGALTGDAYKQLGEELKAICHANGVPFIVNDDVDLALALDADGVHIGQEDDKVEEVRHRIGDRVLGVSAHTLEEAKKALAEGADYLGVGPVFPTSSKSDTREVCGPDFIASLREQGVEAPIVAIGGITVGNASEVVASKADGLSVISAISHAADPSEAARQLTKIWK